MRMHYFEFSVPPFDLLQRSRTIHHPEFADHLDTRLRDERAQYDEGHPVTKEPALPAIASAAGEFWAIEPDALMAALGTAPRGLSAAESARRLVTDGPNRLAESPRYEAMKLLWAQFRSPISLLLLGAAVLSMILGEEVDAFIIFLIILASGGLGFWQEFHARGAMQGLLSGIQLTATVLREDVRSEIPMSDVVAGDIVLLAAGDSVPGDALLIESKDLFVDESALTGESYAAEKHVGTITADAPPNQRTSAVFMGTHVVNGTATAVVAATGVRTMFGAISSRLAQYTSETEFERGIRRFGAGLLEVAAVMALAIVAINIAMGRPILESLLFALALTVGLTPQLLPAIVSVTLAQGARYMAQRGVIVRRLTAIEDIGEIDVLCTDKTGTLTSAAARIEAAFDAVGRPSERVRDYAYLNASMQTGYPNPIDDAICAEGIRREVADFVKVDEVPYDFLRKRLSVLAARGRERIMITKGSLQSVLDVCTQVEVAPGVLRPLAEIRSDVLARFEALSVRGYRCLGLAWRSVPVGSIRKESEEDLVFLGILALFDPPKPGAADSLRRLQNLGIATKMITGDSVGVAVTVAREVGLRADVVLTGAEVRRMTRTALERRVSRTDVFAEMEPNQKERIVLALRNAGHAVGYLGDGINDIPSVHAADVGISVNTAVDVVREAADIVLLSKDIDVLVDGVREGRRAFANTLKYVFITVSANFGNMCSVAAASIFTAFLPLLPKQILLLNLLSDLPAMAIATDRLDNELVARPRRWNIRAIQRFMITFGLISSVFDLLTFAVLGFMNVNPEVFRSAWFLESLISEILVLLVVRTRRPFYRSRPSAALVGGSLTVIGLGLYLPYAPIAGVLGFAPLPGVVMMSVVLILCAYVLTSEAAKHSFFRAGNLYS